MEGIAKEVYQFFGQDLKNSLSDSIKKSLTSCELFTSEKHAIIKLIAKKTEANH